MKRNKLIKVALAVSMMAIVGAIVYFSLQSNPSKEEVYLSDNIVDWKSQFVTTDDSKWNVRGDKIFFFDSIASIGRLTLFTDEIPTEGKKPNRLTASVLVSGDFDKELKDIFYGFELGNKGALNQNKIIFGVNGLGQFIALDGDGKELKKVAFNPNCDMNKDRTGLYTKEVSLTFTLMGNPHGWILFYGIHNETDSEGYQYENFINLIPKSVFSAETRELSLVAFNPIKDGKVWFKDLKVQNDWTPKD